MKERYEEVLGRLKKLGIDSSNTNIVRWEGIDGSTELPFAKEIYATEDFEKKRVFVKQLNQTLQQYNHVSKKIDANFRPGQIAYYYSFIKVIRDAKEKGYRNILFLEDDVFFVPDFIQQFSELKNMKEDILFLGTSHEYWNQKRKKEGSNNVHWVCPSKPINDKQVEYPVGCLNDKDELNHAFLGTFACSISDHAYDKLLRLSTPMRYALDVYLGKLYRENQITAAFFKNPLVYVEYNGISHTGSLSLNGSKNKVLI